jgi:ElaB/YqjD/DUF883 family membrane-anchored ribosome-binding protein
METKPSEFVKNSLPDQSSVDRAAQTAHDTIDKVAAKAGPAVERVRSAATGATETLESKAAALGEMQDQWVATTRSYIRENPLTSIALGVLAGALLSKLSSR